MDFGAMDFGAYRWEDIGDKLENIIRETPVTFYETIQIPKTPSYYDKDVQPIDLINAFNLNFSRGSIVKYSCRAGEKVPNIDAEIEDMYKIIRCAYLEAKRLEKIKSLENVRASQQANG